MLVFHQTRREHRAWAHPPQDSSQLDCMSGANFQACVAIQLDKFDGRAQQRRGFFGFGGALFGRAVGSGFAARGDDQMRFASGASLARDNAAAAEFDVVRVRPKSQQRPQIR